MKNYVFGNNSLEKHLKDLNNKDIRMKNYVFVEENKIFEKVHFRENHFKET